MEVKIGLKSCVLLSIVAFIAEMIVYAGPGWVVLEYKVPEFDMVADSSIDKRPNISIKFGVWFYKVCMSYYKTPEVQENNSEERPLGAYKAGYQWRLCKNHQCYHHSYRTECNLGSKDEFKNTRVKSDKPVDWISVPEQLMKERSFICIAVDFGRQGRQEIAIYVTIGLGLGMCGIIFAVSYARNGGCCVHLGQLACCSLFLSSLLYWLAVVRVTAYVVQLRSLQKNEILDDHFGKDIRFISPWCLVLGGFSAVLMDISAFLLLVIISRKKKGYDLKTKSITGNGDRLSIIVPKGYEELVVPYIQDDCGLHPETKLVS